ncbi:MAG: copper amine oxidase N-terminal domain-containing protein [Fimbriimonas sp.]
MLYALTIFLAPEAIQTPAKRWEASEDAAVVVDGKRLDDVAWIRDNRVQVPMRPIFEALGANVQWFPKNREVVALKDGKTISLFLNENFAYDRNSALLDYPPRIVNGRIMVPLRYVSEALGARVRWDRSARTAFIDNVPSERAE